MAKVNWTKKALRDIREIEEYISKDSELYALRVTNKLIERTEVLKKSPFSGRMVPELHRQDIRELIEGNYRIVYRVYSEDFLKIISIRHGARQFYFE